MTCKEEKINGLKVILAPLRNTMAVTVLALVKAGSRFESRKLQGAAHFVEHLMFKGTQRRPSTEQISKELDSIGAEYNAYTAKDHTGYYIKAAAEHLELALDMLSDMLFHSKFDEHEIKREKGVIIEEINMYEDNPIMCAPNLFEEILYGKDRPLGHNIAGTRASITSMTRNNLLAFRSRYYSPRNMILGIGGGFRNGQALKTARKYFTQRFLNGAAMEKISGKARYSGKERVKIKFREGEQIQLCLGFPSFNIFDPDFYALQVFNVVLGGNMSSRLFINVREKQGLCYFIRSSMDNYEDAGNLMIQAGLDKSRLKQAADVIVSEFLKIKSEGISRDELQKAKDYIEGKTTLDLEDSSNVIEELSLSRLFFGRVVTPKERLKKIGRVNLGDVKRVAERIFNGRFMKLALVGPVENSKELESMVYSKL